MLIGKYTELSKCLFRWTVSLMDIMPPERRSQIMSHIRGKNTTPELIVRKLVYSLGYRYRLHYAKLPGKPDLVFPGRKKVIFVHGCFWHHHEGCKKSKLPSSNVEFWQDKIIANVHRDNKTHEALSQLGWKYMVIWQCEIKLPGIEERIKIFLENDNEY
jgi:DNA mismatch endonuclease, patch repair protein